MNTDLREATASLTQVEEMNGAISALATKHCSYNRSRIVLLREMALDIVPEIRGRMCTLYPVNVYVDEFDLYARYYESATREMIKPNNSMERLVACRLIQAIATYVMYVKV